MFVYNTYVCVSVFVSFNNVHNNQHYCVDDDNNDDAADDNDGRWEFPVNKHI